MHASPHGCHPDHVHVKLPGLQKVYNIVVLASSQVTPMVSRPLQDQVNSMVAPRRPSGDTLMLL